MKMSIPVHCLLSYYRYRIHDTFTLSTLGKIFSRRYFENFFLNFPRNQGLVFLTIYMKCQILFSAKKKKNKKITICRLPIFFQESVKG